MTTIRSSALNAHPTTAGATRWLLWMLWAVIASSFFVQVEPAPTDLLFVMTVGLMVLTGQAVLPSFGAIGWIGIFLFMVGDLISTSQIRHQLGVSIKFWAVTQYMTVSFIVYAGFLNWDFRRAMSVILKAYYFAAFAAATLAFLAMFDLVPVAEVMHDTIRIRSTFKDPNVMAPFLIPGCMIAIWNLTESRKHMWLHGLILTVTIAGVMFAFSRAAWGNLIVAIGLYLTLQLSSSKNFQNKLKLFLVAATGVLLIGVVVLYFGDQLGRTEYLKSRLSLQGYDSTRFGNFLKAVNLFVAHPLGIGPNQSVNRLFQQIHSLYIGVFVEMGVIGGCGFLLILLATMHRAVAKVYATPMNRNLNIMIVSIIGGLLVNVLVVNSIHWRHFFLVLALPWGDDSAVVKPIQFSWPFRVKSRSD